MVINISSLPRAHANKYINVNRVSERRRLAQSIYLMSQHESRERDGDAILYTATVHNISTISSASSSRVYIFRALPLCMSICIYRLARSCIPLTRRTSELATHRELRCCRRCLHRTRDDFEIKMRLYFYFSPWRRERERGKVAERNF